LIWNTNPLINTIIQSIIVSALFIISASVGYFQLRLYSQKHWKAGLCKENGRSTEIASANAHFKRLIPCLHYKAKKGK